MVKPTFTSTATLFTLLGASACAASPDILGHGTHKRHHQLSQRFGILEELGLAPALHGRDAATPPSIKQRSPSSPPSSNNRKRDDETAMYRLLGCVPETTAAGQPLLTLQVPWDSTTMQTCVEACATTTSVPYVFAGIIRGSECHCDGTDVQSFNAIMNNISTTDQSNCGNTCVAGTEKWCGGPSSYQIYYLPTSPAVTADPTTPASVAEETPTTSSTDSTPSTDGTSTTSSTDGIPTTSSTDTTSTTPDSASAPSPTTPTIVFTSDDVLYAYSGCYNDGIDSASRVLRGASILSSTTMTPAACATFCYQSGYPWAGVEYGQECHCGTYPFTDLSATTDGCNTPCVGDSTQTCGANLKIGIYFITDATLLTYPTPFLRSEGWSHKGCIVDDTDARVLPYAGFSIDASIFSVDVCVEACAGAGYNFAGLENGSECYCGNTAPDSSLIADPQDCDIPCPNAGGTCGGLLRLDVYGA